MCVTNLLGVYITYCDGVVFLYVHVIANFVYNIMWEVYCFDVYGRPTFVCNINMSLIFKILRFLSKGSVCTLYVLIDIILIAFFVI